MDAKGFQRELEELITRYGGQLTGPIELRATGAPQQEHYIHPIPEMRGLEKFKAVREVQPVALNISVQLNTFGRWHHSSNDNRRLDPGFREEEQG